MSREFKNPDYEATLNSAITLREALPLNHSARFVVDVITQLDLSAIYTRYAPVGGVAFAPEMLLGLLFYGYATGVFSSRKIERATYESIPFRFVASSLHPDHDTIAHFCKTFLIEIQELFVWLHPDGCSHHGQILLLAQEAGVFQLGNISLDGSKIHADASKHHAVSYQRLLELETQLRQQVSELFTLGEQADQGELALPPGFSVDEEIAFRRERLANLAKAKAVLEARAQERDAAEKAAYEAKVREREEKARQNKRPPRGRRHRAFEQARVEDECRNHTRRIAQCLMQRQIVRQPQVAPQPPDHARHCASRSCTCTCLPSDAVTDTNAIPERSSDSRPRLPALSARSSAP